MPHNVAKLRSWVDNYSLLFSPIERINEAHSAVCRETIRFLYVLSPTYAPLPLACFQGVDLSGQNLYLSISLNPCSNQWIGL